MTSRPLFVGVLAILFATTALAAWDAQQRYLRQVAQGLASAGWPVPSQN